MPVKFQLKNAGGTLLQSTSSPLWLTPQKGGAMSAVVDETIYSNLATSGVNYRYDTTTQQYLYNWSTKGFLAGYWYKIFAKLNDGTTQSVIVGIR